MALVEINGLPVYQARLCLPRFGAWHVDAAFGGELAPGDGATFAIDSGALTLAATAKRGGLFIGTGLVRLVGGKGGLATIATAKFYQMSDVRHVLADLLSDAGETLSSTSDDATLSLELARWTTIQQETGPAISSLIQAAGDSIGWRVLPDGTVWVGPETWPDSGLDYRLITDHPNEGRRVVGLDAPTLLPGTTIGGARVSYVEHKIDASKVRTTFWIE